jgi:broad specificity phosphatase PhoE
MKVLELRRHAPRDSESDRLSEDGRRLAEEVGRSLPGGYDAVFSSPAKRAAETIAYFLKGLGQPLPHNHVVSEGLTTPVEDRWRAAGKAAGSGRIDELEKLDAALVQEESARLAQAVRDLFERIPEDRRGLAVGHSPLIEAAVYGLTGGVIDPLEECHGVLLEQDAGEVRLAEEYRGAGGLG